MPCIPIVNRGYICIRPTYRLRLDDGRYIFITWHDYLGPDVFLDKECSRAIEDWHEDAQIINAIGWFYGRGCRG